MTLVFTFLFMLVIVAGMAIGVMAGRKPIAGSCGGVKALGLDGACQVCGGNPGACRSGTAPNGAMPGGTLPGEVSDLSVDAAAGGDHTRTL